MTEYVHVGAHADILSSGRPVGPGERVQDTELQEDGKLTAHAQLLVDEGVLVDVVSFGQGASNTPDTPDKPPASSPPAPATVSPPTAARLTSVPSSAPAQPAPDSTGKEG